MVTSCHFRVTLGLSGETLASRRKTLGLPRTLDQATCATWHTTASKVSIKCWVISRVTKVMSWAFQGLHHSGRERPPWVQACQAISGGTSSSLSGANLYPIFSPSWGLGIHLVGFIPMEVQNNHLPMCTCSSGVDLQQQQVRPP
jgi:hypothetical protein